MKRFELKQGDVVVLYFDEMVVERDYCVGVDVRAAFEVNDAKDASNTAFVIFMIASVKK